MPRSVRAMGVMMNSEMLYAFLMGTGWFFLVGWLLALVIAYAKAFQGDGSRGWSSASLKGARLIGTGPPGKM
jgi:hypothetical protein